MDQSEQDDRIINVHELRERYQNGRCFIASKIASSVNTDLNSVRLVHSKQVSMDYVPYQSDRVEDRGWGCAWRAIQMVLSSAYGPSTNPLQNNYPSFAWLFSFFGQKPVLEDIYMTMNGIKEIPSFLQNASYAPMELSSGWAEPYIGHLVAYFLGFETELLLVNSYPSSANAPKEVFSRTLNFKEFCTLLETHFQDDKSPVMIDDSQFALVIYGIDFGNEKVTLSIGDPHIYNNKEDDLKNVGLYEVVLNLQGQQLSNSISEAEKAQYIYGSCSKGIHFESKPWMVTYVSKPFDFWDRWRSEELVIE